jgi:hypothetical protein
MRRPLFALTALAPAQVWSRSYVQGPGALTTRGPSWSGDGVPWPPATSLQHPVSLRRPPVMLRRLRRPPTVTAESKPVVAVSTVTRQAPRPAWTRECRRTESHLRPAGPRRPCRKYQAELGT